MYAYGTVYGRYKNTKMYGVCIHNIVRYLVAFQLYLVNFGEGAKMEVAEIIALRLSFQRKIWRRNRGKSGSIV